MAVSACQLPIHVHVRHFLSRALYRYGHVVGRYPWLFIALPVLVFGGLGVGLMEMRHSVIADDVNMPHDSRSFKVGQRSLILLTQVIEGFVACVPARVRMCTAHRAVYLADGSALYKND